MSRVKNLASTVRRAACAAALLFWVVAGPATAGADPAVHTVTYTVTATGELTGSVRYIISDPASQADFNANSAEFLTTVPTAFSAGEPLVYTVTLTDPNQWAYVSASGGCHWPNCGSGIPELHCEIAVDGQPVVAQTATTGVTCSTRPW